MGDEGFLRSAERIKDEVEAHPRGALIEALAEAMHSIEDDGGEGRHIAYYRSLAYATVEVMPALFMDEDALCDEPGCGAHPGAAEPVQVPADGSVVPGVPPPPSEAPGGDAGRARRCACGAPIPVDECGARGFACVGPGHTAGCRMPIGHDGPHWRTDWLDPATLRWAADEVEAQAAGRGARGQVVDYTDHLRALADQPGRSSPVEHPAVGRSGPEADGLEAILDAALTIWGRGAMTVQEIAVCAAVVAGDLARLARYEVEYDNLAPQAELRRELGNLIVSGVRWADRLGLDLDECVRDALAAQAAYVERRGGGRHG